ncbi:MAG: hypothetical protein HC903_12665 [Methylacidiphilales bacterium]|nr:hypothetical protein [Candidatus Methylacidiphilales bacterium]
MRHALGIKLCLSRFYQQQNYCLSLRAQRSGAKQSQYLGRKPIDVTASLATQ